MPPDPMGEVMASASTVWQACASGQLFFNQSIRNAPDFKTVFQRYTHRHPQRSRCGRLDHGRRRANRHRRQQPCRGSYRRRPVLSHQRSLRIGRRPLLSRGCRPKSPVTSAALSAIVPITSPGRAKAAVWTQEDFAVKAPPTIRGSADQHAGGVCRSG